MVKSPVEGSTAALIRLESPVIFSDFIRPICLPDELEASSKSQNARSGSGKSLPVSEKLSSDMMSQYNKDYLDIKEDRQYFIGADDVHQARSVNSSDLTVESLRKEREAPMEEHSELLPSAVVDIEPVHMQKLAQSEQHELTLQWTTCNTLGWSKQREHLQRVQLKMSDMATCENISIATVNSMCTEAAFHKQDCTEEEFAGSPVMCILPDSLRWALIGVASWRIACAPTGIERPRMYDKITPNSAWIRQTISAS